MAVIRPFKALRPTKEKSQLDDVLLQLQNLTGELENRFFKKLAGEHIAKSISD